MKIIQFKEVNKGHTVGYLTVYVPTWRLNIYNITLYEKDGKQWISFPSKAYEAEGKTKYFSFLRFEAPEMMAKFQEAVIAALAEYKGTHAKLASTPPTPDKIAPTGAGNPIPRSKAAIMTYEDDERDGLPF